MLKKIKFTFTAFALASFLFFSLAALKAVAQEDEASQSDELVEFEDDTATATIKKKRIRPDGTEEEVIQSGKVKSKRKGGPRVGDINANDRERIRSRVQSLNFWSFSFGPSKAGQLNNSETFYHLSIKKHWEVNTNAEIRFSSSTNIASKDQGSLTTFGLGASYLPSTADLSPIVGAEFGYGFITGSGIDSKGNFQFGAHAGIRFFRTASTQMSLEGFYNTVNVSGNPNVYGVAVGILFE